MGGVWRGVGPSGRTGQGTSGSRHIAGVNSGRCLFARMRGLLAVGAAATLLCAALLCTSRTVHIVPRSELLDMRRAPERLYMLAGHSSPREPAELAVELAFARPRRMLLYREAPSAVMQALATGDAGDRSAETIMPGSLEIDPGVLGGGVGGGRDETGQCFADLSCGASCKGCAQCQCLMDDGRTLTCRFGKCQCLKQCGCETTDDCGMACGLDYSPELCGQKLCRAGKCYEPFDLPLEDPDWQLRRER